MRWGIGGGYLEVGDDGHGQAHVVEGLQQRVGGRAVHEAHGAGELAEQVVHLLGPVNVDIVREAGEVEQVVHGAQADLLVLELVDVADAEQGLEVGEGDCWRGLVKGRSGLAQGRRNCELEGAIATKGRSDWACVQSTGTLHTSPAAVAVAATGAEEGIFGGQRGRLDPVDGVRARVLARDGAAALALADKRALRRRSAQLLLLNAGLRTALTVVSGSNSLDSFWRWASSSSEGM